jgi:YVTN family beta-propeller protein
MRTLAPIFAALATASSAAAAGSGVVAKIDLGGQPCGIAGANGSVWVSDAQNAELIRIDPATNKVAARTKLDDTPCEIHPAFGSLWVVTQSGNVDRVDPATGEVVAHVRVGRVTYDATDGGGSIWVTNREGRTIQRINLATNKVVKTVAFPHTGKPAGIAWSSNAVWIGDDYGDSVYRLDPRTYKLRKAVRSGGTGANWLAANGSTLWVSNNLSNSITHINTRTRKRVATVKVGLSPVNLDVVNGDVWVPCDQDKTLWRRLRQDEQDGREAVRLGESCGGRAGRRRGLGDDLRCGIGLANPAGIAQPSSTRFRLSRFATSAFICFCTIGDISLFNPLRCALSVKLRRVAPLSSVSS